MGSGDQAAIQGILDAVVGSAQPVAPLSLAQRFGMGKSSVNKILYSLLRKGQVSLHPGKPPLWSAGTAAVASKYQEEEAKLLEIIESSGKHGASTFSIALKLQKSKILVNQMLYSLLHESKVEKIHECPPAWRIRECSGQFKTLHPSRKRSSDCAEDNSSTSKRPRLIDVDATVQHHQRDQLEGNNSWAMECADAVWKKYKELYSNSRDKDIVAGFLLREPGNQKPQIISLGSDSSDSIQLLLFFGQQDY